MHINEQYYIPLLTDTKHNHCFAIFYVHKESKLCLYLNNFCLPAILSAHQHLIQIIGNILPMPSRDTSIHGSLITLCYRSRNGMNNFSSPLIGLLSLKSSFNLLRILFLKLLTNNVNYELKYNFDHQPQRNFKSKS